MKRNGKSEKPVLITGGAGFIGTNLAKRLLGSGVPVLIYDNLSRPGVEGNLAFLQDAYGSSVEFVMADVRDGDRLRHAVGCSSGVFHFAAQVAVTASLSEPVFDFNVNACGTLALLEALRLSDEPVPLVYTSTNKVYGGLEAVGIEEKRMRYEPTDPEVRERGISERCPLDFHSPYGCSKGAADQYVIDYARTYGVPATVFRMSCIYGPSQMGTEDQGWVAYFLKRALAGLQITVYGDGKQVRDVLYVEDLVDAFLAARENIGAVSGHAFNIGGGPGNTLSLLELIDIIAGLTGERPRVSYGPWRAADQRYYVSDAAKFSSVTGWKARTGPEEGVRALYDWLLNSGRGDARREALR